MNSNLTHVIINDKNIYLLGTAHVSSSSKQDVIDAVEQLNPDSICIELDSERLKSLKNPKSWEETDIIQIIKEKKTSIMLVNLILSSFQKRIAKKLDVSAGGEMMQGIESAEALHKELVLIDRNIQTTFKRIYRKHSLLQKIKLITLLISSIFDDEDISEADIESLKNSELLDVALKAVSKDFPVVAEVLIDERDRVLAHNIKNANGNCILAIVGAAHVPGILRYINDDYDIEPLQSIPEKSKFSSFIGWLLPLMIIAMLSLLLFKNPSIGIEQIKRWILWNGSLAALGTLLVKGHPLSIVTSFVMAPLTTLHPLLAVGWFSGLTEAYLRKPKVKDFESLSDDCSTVKGFFNNGITHILLVVLSANLFCTIGSFIGSVDTFKNFFAIFLKR